jgi:AraC-like DNA-binding protein
MVKRTTRKPAKPAGKRAAKWAALPAERVLDSYSLPPELGEGFFYTGHLAQGLTIIYGDYRWKKGYVSTREVDYGDDVVFRIRVSGSATLTFRGQDASFEFHEGDCSVLTTRNPLVGIAREESNGDRKAHVTIRYSRPLLRRLAGECDNPLIAAIVPGAGRKQAGEPVYFESRPISPEMNIVVQQILRCPYEGRLKEVFLEAKCHELLVLHLAVAPLRKVEGATRVKFSQADIERIKAARDILSTNLIDPPPIEELADMIGMRLTKLKIGFQHVFGTTAFAYLRDRRLDQARAMLAEGEHTIEQVAAACGYSNASHFTQAFRKHFAILPKTVRGQRL